MPGIDLAETFHITALFGMHPDEASVAVGNTAPIANSAIVFNEGVLADHERALARMPLYERISDIRVRDGHYRDAGHVAIQALLLDTLTGKGTHKQYSYAEQSSLFEKNCLVYLADYINLGNDDLSTFDAYRKATPETFEKIEGAKTPAEKDFAHEALWQWFLARQSFSRLREECAVNCVTNRLTWLAIHADLSQFPTIDDGRIDTFTTYGLAHCSSLTSKLRGAGLDVTDIALANINDYHPLDDMAFSDTLDFDSFVDLAFNEP